MNALVEITADSAVTLVGDEDLEALVTRAVALFDDGDFQAARLLSGSIYDKAKAAAAFASRTGAAERLVLKARRLQGEALLIEARAKIRIADEWDGAQAAGFITKGGRPTKTVLRENGFTAADLGFSRKEIHDARKLAKVEREAPGFVASVIEARIEAGLEPSRRSVRYAIGTRSASKDEKGEQLYETPIEAMRTLLALESFSGVVKDLCVGKGAILRPMEDAGYRMMISDLIDRGITTREGTHQQVGDFLLSTAEGSEGVDMVMNPPYDDLANAFAAHALRVHKPRKMALLLNLNFMAGFSDPNRVCVMDENPPSRIYIFTRRLPMMHRDGWEGPRASSQMNTGFFVWEQNEDGSYGNGYPQLIRVDWVNFQYVGPLLPGAGGHVAPITFAAAPPDDEFARETPRKTIDERVDEERVRALIWCGERSDFDAPELRRGIGVRPSVADALIDYMQAEGFVDAGDRPERWTVSDQGWSTLKAMAGAVLAVSAGQLEVLDDS